MLNWNCYIWFKDRASGHSLHKDGYCNHLKRAAASLRNLFLDEFCSSEMMVWMLHGLGFLISMGMMGF